MKRTLLAAAVLAATTTSAMAQSGTNSPYSQFGLGKVAEPASGFNRGMNGVGLGFHEGNQINYLNPASYSSLDSLTFLFDAGISGELTNFQENGVKKNARTSNFEYVVGGFRAFHNLGMTFGIIPVTNVGYNYSTSSLVPDREITRTMTYSGSGGLHEAYVGAGWMPVKGFSFGANVGFLWGEYTKNVAESFSQSYMTTTTRSYQATFRSYKIDLGAQYTYDLTKRDQLTAGVTYSLGHDIGGEPELITYNIDQSNSITQTDTLPNLKNGEKYASLKLPSMMGVGFMWSHDNRIKVGLDYSLQQWNQFKTSAYVSPDVTYSSRSKINAGVMFLPDRASRKLLSRIQYRAGLGYASSYYKVNGVSGPKEYSASVGFGIPVRDEYGHQSYLNISGQWSHSNSSMIKENTFRINIGLTFNQGWFAKWKVE